ncbi:hypothetical protein CYMTET_44578, partial [Cymbomonas tetramitiformis]
MGKLHTAAKDGDIEKVKKLVAGRYMSMFGAGSLVDELDEDGQTALHLAASKGHAEVCTFLLGKGADQNAPGVANFMPLHMAAAAGHVDVVALLVAHRVNIDATNQSFVTPLEEAARNGHAKCVGLLLAEHRRRQGVALTTGSRSDDSLAGERQRQLLLQRCVTYGHYPVVDLLLQDFDEPSTQQLQELLVKAAACGHSEVVELLLENGARPQAPNSEGIIPAVAAKDNGHIALSKRLA